MDLHVWVSSHSVLASWDASAAAGGLGRVESGVVGILPIPYSPFYRLEATSNKGIVLYENDVELGTFPVCKALIHIKSPTIKYRSVLISFPTNKSPNMVRVVN